MTGDTPEAAAREVAERQIEKAIARARQKAATMRYSANYEHHCLLDELATELLSFRRAALEEAANVAERHFVGMFTGWIGYTCESQISLEEAEDAAQECGPICARAIRALAGSTKEGE